jgi:hypothetical protein
MAATARHTPTTLEALRDWEERRPERYGLAGGVGRTMSGDTGDHDRLSVDPIRLLGNALRGRPCDVHAANLEVMGREAGAALYPERFVRCGPRSGKRTRTEDAAVVVEALSDGTAKEDPPRKGRGPGPGPRRRAAHRRPRRDAAHARALRGRRRRRCGGGAPAAEWRGRGSTGGQRTRHQLGSHAGVDEDIAVDEEQGLSGSGQPMPSSAVRSPSWLGELGPLRAGTPSRSAASPA